MTTLDEKFLNIMREFIPDFLNEFPEYTNKLHPTIKLICDNSNNTFNDEEVEMIDVFYTKSFKILWKHHHAILYDDHSIFEKDSDKKLEFVESIDFRYVWNLPTTSNQTKIIISKYLKMFIISVLSYKSNEEKIGKSTLDLLGKISEDNMKTKILDTLEELNNFFAKNKSVSNDIPKFETLFETIENVSKGKIGQLAKEIADETFKDININDNANEDNIEDMLKNMFSNPQKLMKMTQSISQKLDSKMKTGELKDSDLMQEASDIVSQMKNVPGFGDLSSILGLKKKTLSKNTMFDESNIEQFWKQSSQSKMPNVQKSARTNNKKKKKNK